MKSFDLKKEKRNRKIGLTFLAIGSLFPALMALMSWKQPIIYDGNYQLIGLLLALVLFICMALCGVLYRYGGVPHFIILYNEEKTLKARMFYVLKLFFCLFMVLSIYFLGGKAITYPLIMASSSNQKIFIPFKITDIEREDYTYTKNKLGGFSYYHNEELSFPWSNSKIDKTWIGRCVTLVTESNNYGKLVRRVFPSNNCK